MTNFLKLTLAYEGTGYCGWQVQRQADGPSLQGTLESALQRVTGETIRARAAGRTDAGVHARGQVVNFATAVSIPLESWPLALNSVLPPDMAVLKAESVDAAFHAQHQAKAKTYRYSIWNSPLREVFWRRFAWQVKHPLDTAAMTAALAHFIGRHDFRSCCNVGRPVESYARTIFDARLSREQDLIHIELRADGFLYNMVRIITGTLTWVGQGRFSPDAIPTILTSRDRQAAGPTVPPIGLCLMSVEY